VNARRSGAGQRKKLLPATKMLAGSGPSEKFLSGIIPAALFC
jgi:hypothetical protein